MAPSVLIHLPVVDLAASRSFYTALGWTPEPGFSDRHAVTVVAGEDLWVVLLDHLTFRGRADKDITDTRRCAAVITSLSVATPEEVDALVDRAVAAGALEGRPQDRDFLRSRSFQDPDGHLWEIVWMDPLASSGDWTAVQQKYPLEGSGHA
ncbi:hypothetical protein GMA12_12385 [Kocuria sediminis]|uniref:VOC domain-containing protein n=1 Tax=Kocuria sediminis TaxID=1038857 RepID=A0A6N8GSM4_9MICC|nr:hypothetical protein [Kocuria sediminis]